MNDNPGDGSIADLQTIKQAQVEADKIDKEVPGIVAFVEERFKQARDARLPKETVWLGSYRDYRGLWDAAKRLRSAEKSRVFVKIPKTKTLAAQGQINEILFGANKFPLSITSTERPDGVAEVAHLDAKGTAVPPPTPDLGYIGDGTRSHEQGRGFLGGLASKFQKAKDMFMPGKAESPDQVEVFPARDSAAEMETTIKDQLTETHASKQLRNATLNMALYGTGIIQGPFSYEEIIPVWSMEAGEGMELKKTYMPKKRMVPRIESVPIWEFYPDPAAIDMESMEYAIRRRKYNRSQLRNLKRLPLFNKANIDEALEAGPNYVRQGYENQLAVDNFEDYSNQTRWEVIEYWGILDKTLLEEIGMEIPEEMDNMTELQVNIWTCNGMWLRVVTNPFEPVRLPYHVVPYERDPNSIWGIGVPENMSDSTIIMNGHARMAIDNLALSGNLIFDVDESSLVPGQPLDMFAGKVFRRQSGSPGQSVFALKFPNTTNENMQMFDKFREFADEETGIPSYSHGTTGVSGTTRTASGMSMLMGAAALNTKTVVKNIDDYLLKPLGEAYYSWNMQFNDDARIIGDIKVKAMGTEALMQEEVRSQRILHFLQIAANPVIAPWVKHGELIKELANAMQLDSDRVTNDVDEAKIYAAIIGQTGVFNPQQPPNPLENGSTNTGNGNITPAAPKMPGQDGFAANTGMEAQGDTGQAPPVA